MNRLDTRRQAQIISCLVGGNSIRSTERMTDTHRVTIMRLMVATGEKCARLIDTQMLDLTCKNLQVDEIWAYVRKKQRHMLAGDDPSRVGDQWTFVALDRETKLVPSYLVGKRNLPTSRPCRSEYEGGDAVTISLEVWVKTGFRGMDIDSEYSFFMVTEASYIYLAIDHEGRKRLNHNLEIPIYRSTKNLINMAYLIAGKIDFMLPT